MLVWCQMNGNSAFQIIPKFLGRHPNVFSSNISLEKRPGSDGSVVDSVPLLGLWTLFR